jgi:hypothetical protein
MIAGEVGMDTVILKTNEQMGLEFVVKACVQYGLCSMAL